VERKPYLSRRAAIRLGFIGAGSLMVAGSALGKYLSDNTPPEGVEENFVRPEKTNTPFQPVKNTQTPENTQTPQSTKVEATNEPSPTSTLENKPLVDQFKIAEKIDLSSCDPMEWLLVTNDNKAILTPSAKPYGYTVENEQNNVFDWRNLTTYTYLEENGIPVVWGHSGIPSLFFDNWVNILCKPGDKGYLATRADAQKAMIDNIIGASVYMIQSPDAALLPSSPEGINNLDSSAKMVEAKVVAGVFIPRWQVMSNLDGNGKPTDQSQMVFDGNGLTLDFVTNGYDKHTSDVLRWIKRVYPDDSKDTGQTNKLFSPLPNPNLVLAKFCVKRLSGDAPAPEIDADGQPVIPASYGRFIMALEVQKI
jgi:hypothetical protein